MDGEAIVDPHEACAAECVVCAVDFVGSLHYGWAGTITRFAFHFLVGLEIQFRIFDSTSEQLQKKRS